MISRFVDRRFRLEAPGARDAYLAFVDSAQSRWDWRWLSYALMSSHIHDGLIAGNLPPDPFYRSTHTRFAQHYKRTFGTLGPIFAARPKNYEVETRKLARMVAYHHRNPVEAGIVRSPAQSMWTSHRAYLRLDPAPAFLDVEWALSIIGFDDTPGGRRSFDEFVVDFDFDFERDHDSLDSNPGTETKLATIAPRKLSTENAEKLLCMVAQACSVDSLQLRRGRSGQATHARRLATHILVHSFVCTMTDAARVLEQRRTALANLVARTSAKERKQIRVEAEEVTSHLRSLGATL